MYHATAILMRDETVEHCIARKAHGIASAEQLVAKAHSPTIKEYWQQVQDGLFRDLRRLEELRCESLG